MTNTMENTMTQEAEILYASDGTRCIGGYNRNKVFISAEEVRSQYEVKLIAENMQRKELIYIDAQRNKRITVKYVRLYFKYWRLWGGYGNPDGGYKRTYRMSDMKRRIMSVVLRKAKKNGWYVWRRGNVLYVETPYGQCSFHVVSWHGDYLLNMRIGMPVGKLKKWFEKFPARADFEWDKASDSCNVICSVVRTNANGQKGN